MTDQPVSEEKTPDKQRTGFGGIAIFFFMIILIVIVCGFGYGYFQLSQINTTLAQKVTDLQSRTAGYQADINSLRQSLGDLRQSTQKSQELSSQQEQLMTEWRDAQKGDLDKWHVAEAQYLVKLANDHLQFSHNVKMALVMLQQADHILEPLQDNSLQDVRKAIKTDIDNLQAAPVVDINSLYLQLAALDSQLDAVPLPGTPLTAENRPAASAALPANAPWWKKGMASSWQALQQIVIVRKYNGSGSLPLVMPEEKNFFYQNLHAQMEGIMWAVLHRNAGIYQASLARTIAWMKQYPVQDAPATKNILQKLDELKQVNIQPPEVNLASTLQLFDNYFAQAHASNNAAPESGN